MRRRVNRIPLLRFSVVSTPFERRLETWRFVWSPMTASTPCTLSARAISGPDGFAVLPAVEVVIAEPIEIEAHLVHQLDRGLVAEEARDRRGCADRVTRGHGEGRPLRRRAEDIEPRLQECRAADSEARPERVGPFGQRNELAGVVADVEDVDLLQRGTARGDPIEDLAARVLRAGAALEELRRRREVARLAVWDQRC